MTERDKYPHITKVPIIIRKEKTLYLGKENAENVEPAKDKVDPARLLTCEEKTLK